jgi:hypothetical protein
MCCRSCYRRRDGSAVMRAMREMAKLAMKNLQQTRDRA